uniref:Uncharacterized protein n=1 Tax=Arundo donax TaxID=35708 RepID=A0A0A9HBY4_ARUDO
MFIHNVMAVQEHAKLKKIGPVLEAPTQGGVWGRIIRGKPYPCNVQCREAVSNPRPLGTSEVTYHCARRNRPN